MIHGISELHCKQVYTSNSVSLSDLEDINLDDLQKQVQSHGLFSLPPDFLDRKTWIKEQGTCTDEYPKDTLETQDGLKYYAPENGVRLIIVPKGRRDQLAKYQHEQLCHANNKKLYHFLKKKYHWPKMASTCAKVTKNCALCQLLLAHRNLAHKHFRAKLFITPRTSYAMDYYAVYKNKLGYSNILGIIDLATKHLVLRAVRQRTAQTTAKVFLYDVIVHKGFPLLIHSDHAREFISNAMQTLSRSVGCALTTTKAHNPQGNATIERVWMYVCKCLRQMSQAQYQQFHLYMPLMALAWNTMENAITNISPFEAEHGMKPRSAIETYHQLPPDSGRAAGEADIQSIIKSVKAFSLEASKIQALAKTLNAQILNKSGFYREYKIGDKVSFYIPPSQKEITRAQRRPKHLLQYRGPATIVAILSPNHTTYRLLYKGRHYERSILNIHPYSSDGIPQIHDLITDQTIMEGSYVACLDDIDDTHYHIAKVLSIVEDIVTVRYYGTKHSLLKQAVWRPLWHNEHTDSVTFRKPKVINLDDLKYTGSFSLSQDKDQLIILHNVGFTTTMKIKLASRKILEQSDKSHHIQGTTWILKGYNFPKRKLITPTPSRKRKSVSFSDMMVHPKRDTRTNI